MNSSIHKLADMHCHIVPGVDDGARDMAESLSILNEEYKQGVRMIILTPHWRHGMFETDRKTVEDQYQKLREEAQKSFPDLTLYLGCEFHVHPDMIEEISKNSLFRMNGSDYVLTEFSAHHDQNYIRDVINQEVSSGLIPIVAHIERYPACLSDPEFIHELRQMGAFVQINADSAAGQEGWSVKRAVLRLVKEGLIDFVGSDAHNTKDRACHLSDAEKVLRKKFGPEVTEKLFWDNAEKIILASHENPDGSDKHNGKESVQKQEPEKGQENLEHPARRPVTIHLDI